MLQAVRCFLPFGAFLWSQCASRALGACARFTAEVSKLVALAHRARACFALRAFCFDALAAYLALVLWLSLGFRHYCFWPQRSSLHGVRVRSHKHRRQPACSSMASATCRPNALLGLALTLAYGLTLGPTFSALVGVTACLSFALTLACVKD